MEEGEATLLDAGGKTVAHFVLNNTKLLDIEKMPSGHYFLQVVSKNVKRADQIIKTN